MSDKTKIEWSDATWNPVTGCNKVSEGCRNCYAMTLAERFRGTPGHYFENGFDITLRPDKLDQPLRWKRARRIFVNSMSDLFHREVPDDYIDQVFAIMALCPQHTFQILTKRPERMADYMRDREDLIHEKIAFNSVGADARDVEQLGGKWISPQIGEYGRVELLGYFDEVKLQWPLPNVWLGVSVETQKAAEERIPLLLQTPAAVRFLSCEPLLGEVNIDEVQGIYQIEHPNNEGYGVTALQGIDWIIVGGESGNNARPMHPEWVRSLRDQCQAARVPFFFKQWGEWAQVHELRCNEPSVKGKTWYNVDPDTSLCKVGKHIAGRSLDGRTWDEFPEVPTNA